MGVGQIAGAYRLRTGGPPSYAKFSVFSKQKTRFCGRKLKDKLWAQGGGLDVALLSEEQKTFARLELFSMPTDVPREPVVR